MEGGGADSALELAVRDGGMEGVVLMGGTSNTLTPVDQMLLAPLFTGALAAVGVVAAGPGAEAALGPSTMSTMFFRLMPLIMLPQPPPLPALLLVVAPVFPSRLSVPAARTWSAEQVQKINNI